MIDKLIKYLEHEQHLISELVRLAERQQRALVKYDIRELDEITSYQESIAKSLRGLEDQRISFLMAWLGLNRSQAANLRLSAIESKLKNEDFNNIKSLRTNLKNLITNLQNLNNTNKVLANRARHSVRDMMNLFTSANRHVFNVKV